MSTQFIIQSIFEILMVAFVIWGLFNEYKIAVWERKAWRKAKRNFRKIKKWVIG